MYYGIGDEGRKLWNLAYKWRFPQEPPSLKGFLRTKVSELLVYHLTRGELVSAGLPVYTVPRYKGVLFPGSISRRYYMVGMYEGSFKVFRVWEGWCVEVPKEFHDRDGRRMASIHEDIYWSWSKQHPNNTRKLLVTSSEAMAVFIPEMVAFVKAYSSGMTKEN